MALARTSIIVALAYNNDLIFYVEGVTSGFGGGKIIVHQSPEETFPPTYVFEELSGNPGPLNPGMGTPAPDNIPTIESYIFPNEGIHERVGVRDASGQRRIKVIPVENVN